MEIPKNAKKIEVFGETFYAVRELMGYMGTSLWGATREFCQKYGWNIYNSNGAFIIGGSSRGHICYTTFKRIKNDLVEEDEKYVKRYATRLPKGTPFQFY